MTTKTYDETPPRRPGIGDFGGGAKADDLDYPPNPVTMTTGGDINQIGLCEAGIAAVTPVCMVTIHFVAGSPVVYSVYAPGTNVTTGTFTPTHPATGTVRLTFTGTPLPPPNADPGAYVTGSTCGAATALLSSTHYDVKTEAAGVAADLNCVLMIY